MNRFDKITDLIDRHKYGILVTLVVHLGVFLYFQIATYQQAVIFQPWDFRSRNREAPENIVISPDQIETPQEQKLLHPPEKITSFVKNENDSRKRNFQKNTNYISSDKSAKEIANEYEESIKREIQQKAANKQQKKEIGLEKKNKEEEYKIHKFKDGQKSSSDAVGGATMVSYSLLNRGPLKHNDWYIRNPGYTCGDVNGIVKVRITVNQGGRVVDAQIMENQSRNMTMCMKNKAVEYALKSRFNFSKEAPQTQRGYITYRFVFRK